MSGAPKRPDPVPYQHEGIVLPGFHWSWKLSLWRMVLKTALWGVRDEICRGCGDEFRAFPHMHEGIISREEVSGWPKKWKILIHCELNCVLLCGECNLGLSGKSPPPRAQIWAEHCNRYGEDVMQTWLESLPFKVPPRF